MACLNCRVACSSSMRPSFSGSRMHPKLHCDLVEGAPLRLDPHAGGARQLGASDVPGDAHDHLVARGPISASSVNRGGRSSTRAVNPALYESPTIHPERSLNATRQGGPIATSSSGCPIQPGSSALKD